MTKHTRVFKRKPKSFKRMNYDAPSLLEVIVPLIHSFGTWRNLSLITLVGVILLMGLYSDHLLHATLVTLNWVRLYSDRILQATFVTFNWVKSLLNSFGKKVDTFDTKAAKAVIESQEVKVTEDFLKHLFRRKGGRLNKSFTFSAMMGALGKQPRKSFPFSALEMVSALVLFPALGWLFTLPS
jgi:hypothetical protein